MLICWHLARLGSSVSCIIEMAFFYLMSAFISACIYYTPENTAKAKEVLSDIGLLQPLISSLADQLLQSAEQRCSSRLTETLKAMSDKTEQFVHVLKDELVKNALLALYTARPGYVSKGNSPVCNNVSANQTSPKERCQSTLKRQDSIPQHSEYDDEEWDRVWVNVAQSLNCIIALVDRLMEHEKKEQDFELKQTDWHEQLYPLVVTLKECIQEVVERAKKSMAFVLLQESACNLPQGLLLKQRKDFVFSQALSALACGFVMKLYAGLDDKGFLQQLHTVGIIGQFESLLSTYSEEIGMLEDMVVGISDLRRVTFRIAEAKSDEPNELQPVVTGRRDHYTVQVPLPREAFESLPEEIKEGGPLHVHPVLFNVGINQQQTLAERFGDISLQEKINQENYEILKEYYRLLSEKVPAECKFKFHVQTEVKELLETLYQNIHLKKRKNVEILWLAATVCAKSNTRLSWCVWSVLGSSDSSPVCIFVFSVQHTEKRVYKRLLFIFLAFPVLSQLVSVSGLQSMTYLVVWRVAGAALSLTPCARLSSVLSLHVLLSGSSCGCPEMCVLS
uniref:Inositol polyphosphate-4-phosphatase type II B n=1 Tax=Erpetoichthys calabaricus TaxID=27687 RepID=A0A8C4TA97_ERPCA